MEQSHFFKNAKWVSAATPSATSFYILRGHFYSTSARKASLRVLGLGFFKCYINGHCINPDTFLPLASDYEAGCDPRGEVLSGHRIYVPEFDITPFLACGDNTIAIHFGGGWYTHFARTFGTPKAIYHICIESETDTRYFGSDTNCRICDSFVDNCDFITCEMHTYTGWDNCFRKDYDDSLWAQAVEAKPLQTQYCTTNCPWDGVIQQLSVKKIGESQNGTIYDCGKNITGYPVLDIHAEEAVKVFFAEELQSNSELDKNTTHGQFAVTTSSPQHNVQPEFTWFGFRYFEVIGNATPLFVKEVHSQVPISSTFHCDNDTLNWIYETFLHTMLCNMHTGLPSDCPHLERRGYTGDGQLTCNAVLTTMDATEFYEKWLQDIADSQDTLSGRIQNTAPYILSGGGPGGWGCAIIEVPYQLYLHTGNAEYLSHYYNNMGRYLDYLESICEFGLVTGGVENIATLGDWCCPNVLYPEKDLTCCDQQSIIPPALVNTYFLVKSLTQMQFIAEKLGYTEDAASYMQKAQLHKKAIQAAYFNTLDQNYVMNIHGANAFAIDLGLSTEKTYQNLLTHYQRLGYYDTGIFATDILTRILFEKGDGELAVALLTGDGDSGFENWRKHGATTFYEYWDMHRSRSHNHPMFGAVVSHFFTYLLGIRQRKDTAGYCDLIIAPQAIHSFSQMSGSMHTPKGAIFVSYTHSNGAISFQITVPANTRVELHFADQIYPLSAGENSLSFPSI